MNRVAIVFLALSICLPMSTGHAAGWERATVRDLERLVKDAQTAGFGGPLLQQIERRLTQFRHGFIYDVFRSKNQRVGANQRIADRHRQELAKLGVVTAGPGGAENPEIQRADGVTTVVFKAKERLHITPMNGLAFNKLVVTLDANQGTLSMIELGRENPGDAYLRKAGRPRTIDEAYAEKTVRPLLEKDPARWQRSYLAHKSNDGAIRVDMSVRKPGKGQGSVLHETFGVRIEAEGKGVKPLTGGPAHKARVLMDGTMRTLLEAAGL